ncbi:spore germination protein [Enterococcus faecalis]|uniref:spore germination protein n=1 Tax=Enterococcus faecalis TaxID=1351 RepID=UPI002FDBA5CC
MDSFVTKMKDLFKSNEDFLIQRDFIADTSVVLLGLNTLVDIIKTRDILQKITVNIIVQGKSPEEIWSLIGEVNENDDMKAISSIYDGKLLIHIDNTDRYIVMVPVKKELERGIESPSNENIIQGAMNSFTEDIDLNIGLVRKQVNSNDLSVSTFFTGSKIKKKVSLLYIKVITDKELVDKISRHIVSNNDFPISDLQGLSKTLQFSGWDTVSKFNTTELPSSALHYLKNGRVILFIDQIPFAIILPNLLWDMFAIENDRNFPFLIMLAIRILRVLGVLITLIFPGLYVALVSVNPEVLQIDLALAVAKSREGVPYPSFVEIILMLVVLELILEASIRLPKSIGPTITMVGGIILGQAAVEANLVSDLLIIILGTTTIANSTIVGIQNQISIKLLKYLIVILAGMFGLLGIISGVVFICAYFASINTFGTSYVHLKLKRNE